MSLSRAAIMAAADRKAAHPSWTLKVTKALHPALYRAIDMVSHDSGGGAGHPYHLVSNAWEPHLADIEQALAALTADQFETFCIGDHEEGQALIPKYSALSIADVLLEEWFDA